ncbi:hypothetical protein D3C86_1836590 [compost metagenome]
MVSERLLRDNVDFINQIINGGKHELNRFFINEAAVLDLFNDAWNDYLRAANDFGKGR